jgi:hypothetical protein
MMMTLTGVVVSDRCWKDVPLLVIMSLTESSKTATMLSSPRRTGYDKILIDFFFFLQRLFPFFA